MLEAPLFGGWPGTAKRPPISGAETLGSVKHQPRRRLATDRPTNGNAGVRITKRGNVGFHPVRADGVFVVSRIGIDAAAAPATEFMPSRSSGLRWNRKSDACGRRR